MAIKVVPFGYAELSEGKLLYARETRLVPTDWLHPRQIGNALAIPCSALIERMRLCQLGNLQETASPSDEKRTRANQRRLELGIVPDRSLSAASRYPCG